MKDNGMPDDSDLDMMALERAEREARHNPPAREPRKDEIVLRLTISEAACVLGLVNDAEAEGTYYGNKEQYRKRLDRIRAKIAAKEYAHE